MVKHTQTMSANCLSVLDHFVGLALKELKLRVKLQKFEFNNFNLHVDEKGTVSPMKLDRNELQAESFENRYQKRKL